MPRIVSLAALVIILLLMAVLFFEVMADFWLPLFLALLLVVMFRPLYRWMTGRCRGHARIAAALTTALILLIVLMPLLALLFEAGYETQSLYQAATANPETLVPTKNVDGRMPPADISQLPAWSSAKLAELGSRLGVSVDRKELEKSINDSVRDFFGPMALWTTQFLGQLLLGLIIMIVAVYYFFADGPGMVRATMRLSPLEGPRTQELIDQFDDITRSIVSATLLAAFVQGLFTGVGFYVAGVGSVFLLSALTMLMNLVPLVGGAIIWVPVCVWMYAAEGRTMAAVLLAIWCTAVVTAVDYSIRPLLLQGRSNLHPLLALLSVLGGMHAMGPIGILVGPMVVAFLQTLVNMVHTELNTLARSTGEPASRTKTLP